MRSVKDLSFEFASLFVGGCVIVDRKSFSLFVIAEVN